MKKMSEKSKKIANIVINSLVALVLIFVLAVTVSILASGDKGYVSVFGVANVKVLTNSMDGEYGEDGGYSNDWNYAENGFAKNEVIRVEILSDEEKAELKVGDVITYYDYLISPSGERELNSHRIIAINQDGSLETKGDNTPAFSATTVQIEDVVGKYIGISVIGKALVFFNTSVGFLVCIVLPSFLILAYFVAVLIMNLLKHNKEKLGVEKERIRAELLRELKGADSAQNVDNVNTDNKSEDAAVTSDDTSGDVKAK